MIIRAIRAENFMKFASLGVSGLPERGLIGIEGPNESGKTTIGEAVLFAFFGKTRSSLETAVSRLIRWGADYLSVEVEFCVPGRGDFLIYREIDKYGTNFVKVIEGASRAEVATGNAGVSEFIARTLKFDFFEFHHSFYHDQGQAGLPPEEQAGFVERMTGIAQIRDSVQALRTEIEQREREFAHYQKDIQRNLQQMEKYERNAAKLPELREEGRSALEETDRGKAAFQGKKDDLTLLRRLSEERQGAARRLEEIAEKPAEGTLVALEEIRGRLESLAGGSPQEREFARREKGDLRGHLERLGRIEAMLRGYGALRAAFSDLAGDLRRRLDPEAAGSSAAEERGLQEAVEGMARRRRRFGWLTLIPSALILLTILTFIIGEELKIWILFRENLKWVFRAFWAFVALNIFFQVILLRQNKALKRLRALLQDQTRKIGEDREELDRIAALLEISGPGEVGRFVKEAEAVSSAKAQELLGKFLEEHGALLDPEGEVELRKELQAAARMEREFRSRIQREIQKAEREVGEAEGALKKCRGDLEKIESEIRECEGQAAKVEALAGKKAELEGRSAEIRGQIDIRRTSIELLDDAAASIRNKLGPTLSRSLREMLPRFTSGRYRDIKVGSDLNLQVFTGEKGDFLELSELSGGTREAISLALRLAISQAFVASRTHQAQFLFLDEPFKMLDEGRALECLRGLSGFSLDLRQVFVIQPAFSPAQKKEFNCTIQTALEKSELILDLGRAGVKLPPGEGLPASSP